MSVRLPSSAVQRLSSFLRVTPLAGSVHPRVPSLPVLMLPTPSRPCNDAGAAAVTGPNCHSQRICMCMQAAFRIDSVDMLAAALSACHAQVLNLERRMLQLDTRDPPETPFVVWRSHTAGCLVTSGTVELPVHAVLLLTGHGARFRDVNFIRAHLVHAGHLLSGGLATSTIIEARVPGSVIVVTARLPHTGMFRYHLHACMLHACMLYACMHASPGSCGLAVH